MLHDKRVKQKFKTEFGVSVDEFVENMNSAGDADLNKIKKEGEFGSRRSSGESYKYSPLSKPMGPVGA